MPLVAERAGVGAGTIHRSFASKEVLVNELFRFWKTEPATALGAAAAAPTARDGFEAFIRRMQRKGQLRKGDPTEMIALVLAAGAHAWHLLAPERTKDSS